MKNIFKYQLDICSVTRHFSVLMPSTYKILKVGLQGPVPTIWAEVNPDEPDVPHRFYLVPTGAEVPDGQHLDTLFIDQLVVHLYYGGLA